MSDEKPVKLDKYDPRVQAAMQEHFEDALRVADQGGPHAVLGFLMGSCWLPEETSQKFHEAFTRYRETEIGKFGRRLP